MGLKGDIRRFYGINAGVGADPVPDCTNGLKVAGVTIVNSSGVIQVPSDTVARADLVEDALQKYTVPLISGWVTAGSGEPLAGPAGAGTGLLTIGGVGTGVVGLIGTAANASTEATSSAFRFTLPTEYVAGGDVRVVITAKCTGAPETKTVDVVCKEISTTAGTLGSDICATAAQTITSSFVEYSFTITATNLVAGDVLQVQVDTNVIIAAASNAILQISDVFLKLDIKG